MPSQPDQHLHLAGPAAAAASGGSTPAVREVDRGPGARLAEQAARAAQVRALSTDPDVVALQIERVRAQVDRLAWTGIILGLGFTAVNVQHFASGGAPTWSPEWTAAWVLDPMVSLVLIAVLRAEQVTARWQIRTGPWVRRARWVTLLATYVMNTWSAWQSRDPAQVVLHSVPPVVVFVAAEAVTGLREALTEAVHAAAHAAAAACRQDDQTTAVAAPAVVPAPEVPAVDVPAAVGAADVAVPARAASAGSTDDEAGASDKAAASDLHAVAQDEPGTGEQAGDELPVHADVPESAVPVDVPGREDLAPEPTEEIGSQSWPAGGGGPEDPRVRELVELLQVGTSVTGPQAAALYGVSARSGRRLLRAALDHLREASDGLDDELAALTVTTATSTTTTGTTAGRDL